MSESGTIRKSERQNKGTPPVRLIMEGDQGEAGKVMTPKNTTAQNSNGTPKPPQSDMFKQIAEMQREFQRQMSGLHKLIVANND